VEPNQFIHRIAQVKPITKHFHLFRFSSQTALSSQYLLTISCSHPLLLVILAAFLLLLVNIQFISIRNQAMADAILSALASTIMGNLNSPILQELGLAGGLTTELENLKRTFRTIQAVLQDAEEKQWKSEHLKLWLSDLKDAAYDVDDVLDEFAIEAQWLLQRRDLKNRVRSFFSFGHNPLVFRLKMAHKLKNVREKLDAIAKERQNFHHSSSGDKKTSQCSIIALLSFGAL
jgi:hypothetical protein